MLKQSYLEQMRAHTDEGGQLSHRNGMDLLAEVERLHSWQPIETAPRDGTHILACRIPIGIRVTIMTCPPTVVHWFDDPDEPGFYTSVNELAPEHPYNPTHWQQLDPLP